MRFEPFGKPVSKVEPSDLVRLRGVAEGWHVEYKREVGSALDVAKSIGAFANHYGGIVVYGVEEERPARTAGAFVGVPSADLTALSDRIRDAARQSLSPVPAFDLKVLSGPEPSVGLADDRSIIVVEVPEGMNPPYVHRSGRIYRRVAFGSDPKEETDRAVLDLLWAKGRDAQKRFRSVLSTDPEFSKGESKSPFLQLFFFSDPLGQRSPRTPLSFNDFFAIMADQGSGYASFGCDNVFTSADGFVARQVADNKPANMVLTWEYSHTGTSIITLPLRTDVHRHDRYLHVGEILRGVSAADFTDWVDVNALLLVLVGLVKKQWRIGTQSGADERLLVKGRLHNVWRLKPYVDMASYVRFVNEFGYPVIQRSEILVPPGLSTSQLIEVPTKPSEANMTDETPELDAAFPIFSWLIEAFGIPYNVLFDHAQELVEAMTRSPGVKIGVTSPTNTSV
ncbi:MAG: ATP-binding protein [Gemmatimonadaceae bacterium]|nr:ATP-binding protein [Gemmatimonadaceae bacterium]